ncbi:MAG TPA: hypothetical protein VJ650_16000 [Gemmatimonadaceae bacterium]|nr:hypothetical protein [Gemmatimonadaceae bacterium]
MTRPWAGELVPLHIALSAIVLLWDLYVARRMTQTRGVPPIIGALTGLAALLIAPALLVALVSSSSLSGRALYTISWVWPLTAVLVTIQAAAATARGHIARTAGIPIVLYDAVLAAVYVTRWMVSEGTAPPDSLLALSAAQTGAQAFAASRLAILSPWFLHIPILAPATPSRRRFGTTVRVALATLASAWTALIALQIPRSTRALTSYDRYADDRLQERPEGDFIIGLKIFPALRAGPPPLALRTDLDLADTLAIGAVSVYITPEGATARALDSLARSLERQRSAGRRLIATLGYSRKARDEWRASPQRYTEARAREATRIAQRLRPDFLVPVVDPFGAGRRQLGPLEPPDWARLVDAIARSAAASDPRIRIVAHVGGFTRRDRVLFDWAAGAGSPVDVVAISLLPWYDGAESLDRDMIAADKWIAAAGSAKDVWVLEARGFPAVHGELNQERALWGALAWATSRSAVKGYIVYQASDYESPTGLRAPGGRIRRAAAALRRAIRTLREREIS